MRAIISALMMVGLVVGSAWARPAGLFETLDQGGHTRSYYLFVPPEIAPDKKVPLVIALHGAGGDGQNMARMTGFDRFAREYGMIIVYPDGIEHKWNDGRAEVHKDGPVDDTGFLLALIDRLATRLPVDRSRIYVTGFSNGGGMTQWMACQAADKIAAIAVVGRTLHEPMRKQCNPARPLPVLFILGEDDPVVPYAGGAQPISTTPNMTTLSGPDSAAFWAQKAGAANKPGRKLLKDARDDGTRVTRYTHDPAKKGGPPVVLYAIDGGGHTWPRGFNALDPEIVGVTSRDLHASKLVLTWLAQFRLPSN